MIARNYRNFIYDEKRGFIFAYVPKVACTNWKCLLRYMAGFDDWLDNNVAHDKVKGGLRYVDMDGEDSALLNDPSIRKFTMVRDPYSRILSAYLNKVESRLPVKSDDEGDYFDDVVRAIDQYRRDMFGDGKNSAITFEVFLRWIANEAGMRDGKAHMRQDEHWTPQAILLRQPKVKFNIVGRFENLSADSERILTAMGCDNSFPTQKDVKFAPTKAAEKLALYYTPNARALVETLYAEDFANFAYEDSCFG